MSVLVAIASGGTLEWARAKADGVGALRRCVLGTGPAAAWRGELSDGPRPARVLAADAAGNGFDAAFRAVVRRTWDRPTQFVLPRAMAAGLVCAEPHSVGADRWLAMIGAVRRARSSALAVVTCGSVLAVDLVDAAGRHRGGYVVPGVGQMRDSLYARTGSLANLAALAAPASDGLYGVNTAGAIERGARFALAALLDRATGELETLTGRAARRFCTGPGLDELRGWLPSDVVEAPSLALEGFAALAATADAAAGVEEAAR
jgi:type III pantothenate kinase